MVEVSRRQVLAGSAALLCTTALTPADEPIKYYWCDVCHGRGFIAYGDSDPMECPKCEEAAMLAERGE